MKKFATILILTFGVISCEIKNKNDALQYDLKYFSTNIAFYNAGTIFYSTSDDKKISTILDCSDPNISPDGTELAFTESIKSKRPNAAAGDRQVSILNLKSKKKIRIPYNSEQVYGAVWSNDGKKIAIKIYEDSKWSIGIVENKKVVKILKSKSRESYHSISWASDNNTILTHSFDTLFFIDSLNYIRQKMSIKEITNGKSVGSGSTFTLTKDNRFLIFNAMNFEATFCNENEYRANLPDAIFKYDIKLKKLTKLTPDELFCHDYQILEDKVYFSASQRCNRHQSNIYTMNLEGKEIKEILKNASNITIAKNIIQNIGSTKNEK